LAGYEVISETGAVGLMPRHSRRNREKSPRAVTNSEVVGERYDLDACTREPPMLVCYGLDEAAELQRRS
jgi:hypothetical protein